MGYPGKNTILRDFIRPYCQKPKKQSSIRCETPPGKQDLGLSWVFFILKINILTSIIWIYS
jgi:hypothetical protein